MEELRIEITSTDELLETPLDEQTLANAIFVTSANFALHVSNIKVSGKYNREYKLIAFCVGLNDERVLVEGNLLIVCLWSDILIIDLQTDKLVRDIDLDCAELFSIHKFQSGFFIHGELENRFLDKDFNVVWEESCCDIFFNSKVDRDLEIFEDYIVAWDWYGYKHYYNETGEFKTERYLECRMSD